MIFLYLPRQRERPPDDRLSESTTDHRIGYTRLLLPCERITLHPKVSHLQGSPNKRSRQDYSSEEPLPPVQEAKTGIRKLSGGSTSKSPRMEPLPHTPKDGHSCLILIASAKYVSSNTLSSSTKMIRSADASWIPRCRAQERPSSLSNMWRAVGCHEISQLEAKGSRDALSTISNSHLCNGSV